MIVSFADRATEDLYHGRRTNRIKRFPPNIIRNALYKLDVLRAAKTLQDLRAPPGNRLEALSGNYQGYYSIRINQQWCFVFRWENDAVHDPITCRLSLSEDP